MRFKNKITGNIISASQEFINSLVDVNDYELVVEVEQEDTLKTPKSLLELKQDKLKLSADNAQAKIEEAYLDVPNFEIETFPIQQAEYFAWVADNEAPTPYIDKILLDEEPKSMFMLRISGNMSRVQLLHKQRRLNTKLINEATNEEELNNVEIDYE